MTAPEDELQDGKGHHLEYSQLIKKLILPAGFTVPARLSYEGIVATAITRDDLHDDVAGINASLALIQQTRGGGWPTEPVTEDFNFVDLVWHELEFREGKSFTYVVRTADATYLGCCYLYPMGRRTPLSEQTLRYDVDVCCGRIGFDNACDSFPRNCHTAGDEGRSGQERQLLMRRWV
jgi:hypothetical protein